MIDIVTVFHNEETMVDALALKQAVKDFRFVSSVTMVDNIVENRGFAKACNLGAVDGTAPIIGFLNPDAQIHGDFGPAVVEQIEAGVTITGERFGKPAREIKIWGCRDWVCGAAFFVERDWFESVGGFDERFVWSWEETALIRKAQDDGKIVKSIPLPITHESPVQNADEESAYKTKWFDHGADLFYKLYPVKAMVRGRKWR